MALTLGENLTLDSNEFLDNRQRVESVDDLNGLAVSDGFEVFVINEGEWYIKLSSGWSPRFGVIGVWQ